MGIEPVLLYFLLRYDKLISNIQFSPTYSKVDLDVTPRSYKVGITKYKQYISHSSTNSIVSFASFPCEIQNSTNSIVSANQFSPTVSNDNQILRSRRYEDICLQIIIIMAYLDYSFQKWLGLDKNGL